MIGLIAEPIIFLMFLGIGICTVIIIVIALYFLFQILKSIFSEIVKFFIEREQNKDNFIIRKTKTYITNLLEYKNLDVR